MHRINILRGHLHPTDVVQTIIETSPTNAKQEPDFHKYNHKQMLTFLNSGGNVKLAQKLGEKYYNFAHENVISQLHNNGCLSITLNRVKHYNALSYDMVVDLVLLLSAAASDSLVKFIVLSSNSPAAYCAGGDIKALTADPIGYVADFFSVEFNLNFLLSRIDKPVIALLNGITMGGGVGISVYAHYRVGQQNKFVFAMPESGIGLFTDIGGGWFLPKNSPSIGVANYIGMLGARLDTKDALYAHAITHVATQDEFKKLKDQLCQVSVPNSAYETGKTHQIVKKVLDAVHVADDNGKLSLQRDWIDKTFDAISVEQIIENLKQKSGDQAQDQWGEKTLKDLLSKSPTSIKVTFETIRRGSKGASLQDVLTTDYRLGSRLVKANDFREGVRAVVVEKKNDPKWSPNSIDQVHDDYIRELFDEPLEQEIQFYMLH